MCQTVDSAQSQIFLPCLDLLIPSSSGSPPKFPRKRIVRLPTVVRRGWI